jgi:transposase
MIIMPHSRPSHRCSSQARQTFGTPQVPDAVEVVHPGNLEAMKPGRMQGHGGTEEVPDELRERAVKMVLEIRERDGKGLGELARVARQLGVHPEALRSWVKQAEIDGGSRPGTSTDDKKRIAEREREVRELRRANDILKAASAYFARELAPRLPR